MEADVKQKTAVGRALPLMHDGTPLAVIFMVTAVDAASTWSLRASRTVTRTAAGNRLLGPQLLSHVLAGPA
jgi:hypothetical protein